MKNLDIWKNLIKDVMDVDVEYSDKVSIFAKHDSGYVVIENEGRNGLQLQFRRTFDHDDIVVEEDIVIHGKMVSGITSSNYEDVKKVLVEFTGKL